MRKICFGNKTKYHMKHVKLKEKVLLFAHKNYKPDGFNVYA